MSLTPIKLGSTRRGYCMNSAEYCEHVSPIQSSDLHAQYGYLFKSKYLYEILSMKKCHPHEVVSRASATKSSASMQTHNNLNYLTDHH